MWPILIFDTFLSSFLNNKQKDLNKYSLFPTPQVNTSIHQSFIIQHQSYNINHTTSIIQHQSYINHTPFRTIIKKNQKNPQKCQCLDHPILPWNCTSWRVSPVLDQIPLLLSIPGGSVGASSCLCVLQVTSLSPCSCHKFAVLTLWPVKLLILSSWVPGPHEVVQDQACFHNELNSGGVSLPQQLS